MKISIFFKSLKLFVNGFNLLSVWLNREIAFVLVTDIITELLFDFDLCQSFFQLMELALKEMWQIVLNFFICKEA